jgi:fibronectin type 3 domain-containing protein
VRRLALAALGICLAASLGCAAALDVERVRSVFVNEKAPEAPVLSEAPPARLGAVEGLRTISGELRSVPLRWDPVLAGDVGGYAIERATREEGPFQRIAVVLGRFSISYHDRGADLASKVRARESAGDLGDGNTYYYRVRPFDSFGHLGAQVSPPQAGTTAKPPAAPAAFRAYSQLPRQVALSWEPLADPTVTGYVVLRSPSANGNFLTIARLSDRFATTFLDRGLGDLRVFYYRVAAVNGAGGVGEATQAVRAVTKPDPLPPAGVRVAEQALGRNVVAWERNVERDLAGYRLFRRRAGAERDELVAEVNADTVRVADDAVGAGEPLRYAVLAFDRDGLESELSDAIETTSVDYELRAEAEGGAVVLRWDEAIGRDLAEVRVIAEGSLGDDELARVASDHFEHRDVRPGQTLRYRLVGIRADGSEAPPSRVLEVKVPE